MPIATYTLVALDCPDPASLADFYAKVLGGEVTKENDEWYELAVPGGARLAFQWVPGHRPPEWPRDDANGQQLHIDMRVTDIEAAQRDVLAVGARPLDLDDQEGERPFRVYADPAGHPFCLCW